jgi:hypothetical protein
MSRRAGGWSSDSFTRSLAPLEFEWQVLHVPDAGQRLIVYCAEPRSATWHAFRTLAGLTTTRPE